MEHSALSAMIHALLVQEHPLNVPHAMLEQSSAMCSSVLHAAQIAQLVQATMLLALHAQTDSILVHNSLASNAHLNVEIVTEAQLNAPAAPADLS